MDFFLIGLNRHFVFVEQSGTKRKEMVILDYVKKKWTFW